MGLLEVPAQGSLPYHLSRDLTISQRYLYRLTSAQSDVNRADKRHIASPKPADRGLSLCRYWEPQVGSRVPVLGLQGLAMPLASKSWGGDLPVWLSVV
jgi:hypothetical protein